VEYRKIYTQCGWVYLEEKPMTLDEIVEIIGDALEDAYPHRSLKFAAMYLIAEYERRLLPDWIEALANGNLDVWDAVLDEVRNLKKAEEMENDNYDDV